MSSEIIEITGFVNVEKWDNDIWISIVTADLDEYCVQKNENWDVLLEYDNKDVLVHGTVTRMENKKIIEITECQLSESDGYAV
ncbi:hypothetical protein JW935_14380 [candidate division KSB1 bacterium]|nr:hypothetical protein [candidate division KSB1 bacterium]